MTRAEDHYTGEGPSGSMEFTRGNKALRDHKKDEKRVHLFVENAHGLQEYAGEMEVRSWRFMEQKDVRNRKRKSIVFELARVPSEPEATVKGLAKGLTLVQRRR